jgi:hypothetical protein
VSANTNIEKMAYLKALDVASLEYTAVINSFLLGYHVVPHTKSHLAGFTMAVDIANKAAAIPGSGDVPTVFV